jgi:hypothetical protein
LNRALLARQMLLEREKTTPLDAIGRLAGMQAQVPRPPFVGLWTRLRKFERADLIRLLREKKVVRATAMRATLHLLTTADFLVFRPALTAALTGAASGIVGKRATDADLARVHGVGREFFMKNQLPFEALREHIELQFPGLDVRALAYSVRLNLPLVIVPDDAPWGFTTNAGFTLADRWLGRPCPPTASAEQMVLSYLAAFGPATPADAQNWSGLRGLREIFEALRPRLVTFRDEKKRELFDLPKAPRPDGDTPAPVRFLPEYDNIVLGHADRTRIIADEHRPRITTKNLQILGTFLIDGFVAGSWKSERARKSATLSVTPFGKIPKRAMAELKAEAEAMLRFMEPDAAEHQLRIAP